jgi:hypothetical protein
MFHLLWLMATPKLCKAPRQVAERAESGTTTLGWDCHIGLDEEEVRLVRLALHFRL